MALAIIDKLPVTIDYGFKLNNWTIYIYNLTHAQFNELTGCNISVYTEVYNNIIDHVEDMTGEIPHNIRFVGGNNESN